MTDEVAPTLPWPTPQPPPRHRVSRLAIVTVVVANLAVADGVVALHVAADSRAGHHEPLRAAALTPEGLFAPAARRRIRAIRTLLRRRSDAIVHHDQAEFLAGVDPREYRFHRQQRRMFANLANVPFASWTYRVSPTPSVVARRPTTYGAPSWSPASMDLGFRIAGFDRTPTRLRQYPTFVERGGRWYLASLSDFRMSGEVSASELWDYLPVSVYRRPRVLVLGPRSEYGTMVKVAGQVQAAIPRVAAVWGANWTRRAVVQIPATQHEMALLSGERGDVNRIAAVTSAEVSPDLSRPAPTGGRITINPRVWPTLGVTGTQVVLTHELTHVASFAHTGGTTPRWLVEGFADYVGYLDSGIPVADVAAELIQQVRAHGVPEQLPSDSAFDGGNPQLASAYELGWMACRYVATRVGQAGLVRFYRQVGRSTAGPVFAVDQAVRTVLRLTPNRFTRGWRQLVKGELA